MTRVQLPCPRSQADKRVTKLEETFDKKNKNEKNNVRRDYLIRENYKVG